MKLSLSILLLFASSVAYSADKLNVLFIVADDLRPELGCYGSPALSPNIDSLAARGVQFNRAYCQQALCNPSRSSFLTGKRPDTLRHWSNSPHFRDKNPDVVTLPEHFKNNGYITRDVGKIFHNWHTKDKGDRRSWSSEEYLHYANHGDDKPKIDTPLPANQANAPRCERVDVPDEAYYDGRVANEAVKVLGELKDKPFFLAVGLWKPHAPFNAPSTYWGRYHRVPLPKLDASRPKVPGDWAYHESTELRGLPPKQLNFSEAETNEMRLGYFANVAYMDAQIGKVLKALDDLKLRDKTLIVFVSDHGYHIGEHGLWGKTSCFELDARVPLIIVSPDSKFVGKKTEALVELVDLFPTLVDMCRLPELKGLEGKSLTPILADPATSVKTAAYTQHPRPAYFDRTEKGVPDAMGYSVRTKRVRYTEWRDWKTGELLVAELYDAQHDPGETVNAIDNPRLAKELTSAQELLKKATP